VVRVLLDPASDGAAAVEDVVVRLCHGFAFKLVASSTYSSRCCRSCCCRSVSHSAGL
jgi:hypothetical protein